MKKPVVLLFLFMIALGIGNAQHRITGRLKVFVDCTTAWCDMQFIRSEITLIDFLHDHADADVHVLITSQETGSGGREYQLIYFGQQIFRDQVDTLRFHMGPVTTEYEDRDMMLKFLKAGLVPFISQTSTAQDIEIHLKLVDSTGLSIADTGDTYDPWNDWVMRVSAGGFFDGDANYRNTNYNGNISANRITDKTKIGFGIYGNKNKSTFDFNESDGAGSFVVNNHNWTANHYLVKSISPHWSWSYEVKYSQNTFSNNKGRFYLLAAAEYNLFPYSDVNTKLFTFSYGLTARNNTYYDTTIYNKKQETLLEHRATAYLSLNQKWGISYAGISYHNYFHNWRSFNLGLDVYTSVRITGGLSFYILAFGGLTRDQIALVKGNATPEEVLARRRQLASGYTYFSSIGINYRFGSRLNNVVNPRFDRSSSANSD